MKSNLNICRVQCRTKTLASSVGTALRCLKSLLLPTSKMATWSSAYWLSSFSHNFKFSKLRLLKSRIQLIMINVNHVEIKGLIHCPQIIYIFIIYIWFCEIQYKMIKRTENNSTRVKICQH
ncbi:hypothetical protein BpHYR1_037822 [Brachionus plicatilis]|uniref:Uncharacterized protein n=1 Tax=Brachionus plicatilis TaxID=10195 RepID=A0A3M7PJ03_BRAPC|nr:hypothetical protein BpHYR1_037822 [Brachionus plicatilis]